MTHVNATTTAVHNALAMAWTRKLVNILLDNVLTVNICHFRNATSRRIFKALSPIPRSIFFKMTIPAQMKKV